MQPLRTAARLGRGLAVGLCVGWLAAELSASGRPTPAAGPVQEPLTVTADAAVRAKLTRSGRLTEEEIALALDAIARTIRGRTVRATDGTETIALDAQGRQVILAILTGTLPVEDLGVSELAGVTVRGFRAPATPARSEIGAKQTLWVDVQALEPRRFELVYEVPGVGDAAFDLRIE